MVEVQEQDLPFGESLNQRGAHKWCCIQGKRLYQRPQCGFHVCTCCIYLLQANGDIVCYALYPLLVLLMEGGTQYFVTLHEVIYQCFDLLRVHFTFDLYSKRHVVIGCFRLHFLHHNHTQL